MNPTYNTFNQPLGTAESDLNAEGHSAGRHRNQASTACESCKKYKRKCDQNQPCSICISKGVECVYDQSKDGRRGRKRHLDELTARSDALDVLLASIRTSDNESLQELLSLARANVSVDELVQTANKVIKQNELRGKSRARLKQAVISIASLTEDPPVRVPASPWTRVTDDDEAVSHLVSIYFTWQHCYYPSLDQNLFVQGMKSKDLSSRFCSPFLVNCVLFVACLYTDHPAAFADPEDPSTRGRHFEEEASRLWTLQEGKASLTNLQAFPSLISACVFLGKDRVGAYYTNQSISLAQEFRWHVRKSVKQGQAEYESRDFQRSFSLAARAAFMIQSEVAIAWMKPLELRVPVVQAPYAADELHKEAEWRPYPKTGPAAVFYPFSITDARYHLYTIAADLLPFVLSGSPDESPLPGHPALDTVAKLNGLDDIEQRLLQWYDHLPQKLKFGNGENPATPGDQVNMHLAYQYFQINVQSIVLRAVVDTDPRHAVAKDKIIHHSRNMANLFQLVQQSIGLGHFGVAYFHAASVCALALVAFLTEPGVLDVFHTMVVVLSNVARRWMLARGVVKMVWITLQDQKLDSYLSPATSNLFKLNAEDSWGPKDHHQFNMCAYPNYAAIGERGRNFVEMGELLHEYAALQLGGEPKEDRN